MKVPGWLIYRATAVGIRAVRLIMPMVPDRAIGRLLRIAEKLVYMLTKDKKQTASLAEIAEIFESGPPVTTTIRTIVANMEIEIVANVLKCGSKMHPYGTG
jgi:hypothetical protein